MPRAAKTKTRFLIPMAAWMLLGWAATPGWNPPPAQADLRVEIEPSMFRGTVESINLQDSRVTIKTDFGRLLSLTVQDCAMLGELKEGDRVMLEEEQSQITITKLDQPVSDVTSDLPAGGTSLGASGHCVKEPL